MKTKGKNYRQDEDGQWWYYAKRGTRTRAKIKMCEGCGEEYVIDAYHASASKFCSRECSMRHTGKSTDKFGENHPAWSGGRKVTADGYIRVWLSPEDREYHGVRRTILEHRLVMAKKLGRPLKRGETVHHKNGDRSDNRIRNLELRVGSHGPGASTPHCATCTCFA